MLIKHLELFAGIGGFRRGFELLEKDYQDIQTKCIGFSEIDPWAKKTYNANYSTDSIDIGDIVEFASDKNNIISLPDFDILTGGFPCQSFSVVAQNPKRLGVKDEKADRPVLSPELQRNLICKGVQTFSPAMKSERVLQRKLLGIRWAVFIVCLIPLAAYVLNGVHFDHPHDTEADLLALLWVLIPCAVLGITCLAITGVLQDKSYAREIEAAKNQATAERKAGINRTLEGTGKTYPQTKDRFTFYLRATIFILAVVFILAGIQNGGLEDVLIKANVICMECVGLG